MSEWIRKQAVLRICENERENSGEIRAIIYKCERLPIMVVRHGEWEEESESSAYRGMLVSCSECGAFLDPKKITAYRFCYNCGAKMDGGKNDGNAT